MKNSLYKILMLLTITILSLSGLTAQSTSRARKAREKLDLYEIPFTVEAFLSYVDKGNYEVIQRFIDAGFDVNTTDIDGNRAIILAAEKEQVRVMQLLIKSGADVDAKDADGTTALMYAAYYRRPKAVALLVKSGANVNLQNNSNMTALMYAILGGDAKCVDGVLTKETDLGLQNSFGKNALAIARDKEFTDLGEFIKAKMDYLHNRQKPEKKEYELRLKRLGKN